MLTTEEDAGNKVLLRLCFHYDSANFFRLVCHIGLGSDEDEYTPDPIAGQVNIVLYKKVQASNREVLQK
jgi:hypothetical protein